MLLVSTCLAWNEFNVVKWLRFYKCFANKHRKTIFKKILMFFEYSFIICTNETNTYFLLEKEVMTVGGQGPTPLFFLILICQFSIWTFDMIFPQIHCYICCFFLNPEKAHSNIHNWLVLDILVILPFTWILQVQNQN